MAVREAFLVRNRIALISIFCTAIFAQAKEPAKEEIPSELGVEGFAENGDVKIHYVTKGEGPLVVLIHGFPDYWYSWRDQIPALAEHFQVVAIDQRGYNQSSQPTGVDNYKIEKLVSDVAAVVKHFGKDKAVICGHDWGGLVAWTFAMTHPEMTDRLIILNLPHPKGLMRELANNPEQQKNSAYARRFQEMDPKKPILPALLATWVKEAEAKKKYIDAFNRSSFEGMISYYKVNYPREPYTDLPSEFPPVKCRVLMIHGLADTALLPGALSGTWDWVEQDLTLVTVPKASHFVHRDRPDFVTKVMVDWLTSDF